MKTAIDHVRVIARAPGSENLFTAEKLLEEFTSVLKHEFPGFAIKGFEDLFHARIVFDDGRVIADLVISFRMPSSSNMTVERLNMMKSLYARCNVYNVNVRRNSASRESPKTNDLEKQLRSVDSSYIDISSHESFKESLEFMKGYVVKIKKLMLELVEEKERLDESWRPTNGDYSSLKRSLS